MCTGKYFEGSNKDENLQDMKSSVNKGMGANRAQAHGSEQSYISMISALYRLTHKGNGLTLIS